jgi:uncharacterized protein with PQ loop repeat
MSLIEVIGFVPAIVFPVATIIQLVHLLKSKSAGGVSAGAWGSFAIGNVCLFTYTEKYDELQSIIGLLFTSVMQVYIVYLILKYRRQETLATA